MNLLTNKKNLRIGMVAFLGIILLGGVSNLYSIKTPVGDDVDAMELRSIIVEGWEKEPWIAKTDPGEPIGKVESKLLAGVPENLKFDGGNKNSYGVRYSFVYPGINNKVVLTPPDSLKVRRYLPLLDDATGERKFYDVNGIELPGKVKALSVWVLGRGNEYELEAWVEDWAGDTHILKFGSIDFIGWKPLTFEIPESIPQGVDSYPQTKTLVLKKFVLRSIPETSNEKVIVFFDSVKVLTDMYDLFFDGAEMSFDDADKAEKERLKKYEEQLKNKSQGNGSSSN